MFRTSPTTSASFPPSRSGSDGRASSASPIAFIVFGEYGGLLPATFACVFVAALGDKETTLKQALILAAGITVLGVLLFSFLLKIPFPILRGIWF